MKNHNDYLEEFKKQPLYIEVQKSNPTLAISLENAFNAGFSAGAIWSKDFIQ